MPDGPTTAEYRSELLLVPDDHRRLANLSGQLDEHLRLIEQRLDVRIKNRGNRFELVGPEESVEKASAVLEDLFDATERDTLDPERVHLSLMEHARPGGRGAHDSSVIHTRRRQIRARGAHQAEYARAMRNQDLTFGIGPAGTGKTYLSLYLALNELLNNKSVQDKVYIVRSVVPTRDMGYLPGDQREKDSPHSCCFKR